MSKKRLALTAFSFCNQKPGEAELRSNIWHTYCILFTENRSQDFDIPPILLDTSWHFSINDWYSFPLSHLSSE